MELIDTILVDDDRMALDYIEELIDWEAAGFRIAGRALDGNQGYLLYRKACPRLVIADVRMPVMNGVELAEKILWEDEDACVLLLSNFDEFSYVRDAMRAGIRDYILKHELDEHTLLEKLAAVRQELEARGAHSRRSAAGLLQACFSGQEPSPSQNKTENDLLRQPFQYLLVREALPFPDLARLCGVAVTPLTGQKAGALVASGWAFPEQLKCVARLEPGLDVAVLERPFGPSRAEERRALFFGAQRLLDHLRTATGRAFTVLTVSEPRPIPDAARLFREVSGGLAARCFSEDAPVVELTDPDVPRAQEPPPGETDGGPEDGPLAAAIAAARRRDYPGFLAVARVLLNGCIADGTLTPREWESACGRWRTAEGFIAWARAYAAKREPGLSQPVAQAVAYIRRHYREPELSVRQLAEHVSLSRSRLSALFGEEVGRSILEYLTEYRIERAQQLIDEGGYKVYEVSELVGYSSSQYFCKVYKKRKGYTPFESKKKG